MNLTLRGFLSNGCTRQGVGLDFRSMAYGGFKSSPFLTLRRSTLQNNSHPKIPDSDCNFIMFIFFGVS